MEEGRNDDVIKKMTSGRKGGLRRGRRGISEDMKGREE